MKTVKKKKKSMDSRGLGRQKSEDEHADEGETLWAMKIFQIKLK